MIIFIFYFGSLGRYKFFIYIFCVISLLSCRSSFNENNENIDDFEILKSLLINCELKEFKKIVDVKKYQYLPTDKFGVTLLYYVASHCNNLLSNEKNDWEMISDTNAAVDIINYIISKGCDVNQISSTKKNALYYLYDSPPCLYSLVENGADVNYIYPEGKTILEILIKDITEDEIKQIPLKYDKIDNNTIQDLMSIYYLINKGANLATQNNAYSYLLEEAKNRRPLLYKYLTDNRLPRPNMIKK